MHALQRYTVVMWIVVHASMTSQTIHYTYSVRPIANRCLNVTSRDVMTHSSLVKCSVVCGWTSWCLSVNVASDGSTCQLLSEEVSDVASLQSAEGWSYLREFRNKSINDAVDSDTFINSVYI